MRGVGATRAVLLLTVAALACSGPATAGDAKRQLTKADGKRAASILLGKSDLADGFRREPRAGDDEEIGCAALDESDLIVTGEAQSLFTLQRADLYVRVGSSATLYRSATHAARSWQRGVSVAGLACLRRELARTAAKEGLRFVSMTRMKVGRLAQRAYAVRVVLASKDLPVPIYYDFVALSHGRAQAAVGVLAVGAPVPDRDRLGFARLVSARMAKALGLSKGPTA